MLRTSHLSVQLGSTTILHEIECVLEPRCIYALIGPNGSGKTTLLRALCGFLPYTGNVTLMGQSLPDWSNRERATQLSYIPQRDTLHYDFTVEELIRLGLDTAPSWRLSPSAVTQQRVEIVLAQLGLLELRHRSLQQVSGGERQRAFLAMAAVHNAPLMLLDEPTAHLDLHHQHHLLSWLRTWLTPERTALVSLHDLSLALRYADHVLVLQEGRLIEQGPPLDVLTPALLANVFSLNAEIVADSAYPNLMIHPPSLSI